MIPETYLATLGIIAFGLACYIGGHVKGFYKGVKDPRDEQGKFVKRTIWNSFPWG